MGDFPFQGKSQVAGVSVITITNDKSISSYPRDLRYYDGFVEFSPTPGCIAVNCHVIALHNPDDEIEPKMLFAQLSLFSSPCIAKPLAYGKGLGKFSSYNFLAVPPFTSTFARYMREGSGKAIDDNNNRFTEEFIEVVGNIVRGIVTLHGEGFYCPFLKASDVLISIVGDMVTSKIWNFRVAVNAKDKSGDWIRLGNMIQLAASKQLIYTAEMSDLCNKLKNKDLEGLQVLRHAALSTVRQKFDNILALNLYVLAHSHDQFAAVIAEDPPKKKHIDRLQTFLKSDNIDWCAKIPTWISSTKEHQNRTIKTGAEFVAWLRYIVEHEFLYIPPEKATQGPIAIQKFGCKPDLEAQVRALMEEIFLQAQNLTADLEIEY